MAILVTGGAGYIGSHCVLQLLRQEEQSAHPRKIVVYDNLSTGHPEFILTPDFVQGDIHNRDLLVETCRKYNVTAVMHFAAFTFVGESVTDPEKYYRNNVIGTLTLLSAMREAGVKHFIFSSSCAIYGTPLRLPLSEDHPFAPVSPYGFTKRVIEEALADYARAYDFSYVSLRYFNAAGADPEGRLGEVHEPETHLIPLVLQAASGRRANISVFGTDYDTPDGTCIRDYIHINDLAHAHLLALGYLEAGGASDFFNLGTEHGHTVQEVIEVCRNVSGRPITVIEAERRPGDPPALVASSQKIKTVLGWNPQYHDLYPIIETAWQWELKQAKQPVH